MLRPSRQTIEAEDLTRCVLCVAPPDSGRARILESFVSTNLAPDAIPRASSNQNATILRDWETVPPPQRLLIKFPGTAGRAERSSPFPANLIPRNSCSRRAELSVDDPCSRRAELSIDNGKHYEVWTWNPPGYGRSSGRASLSAMVPTAEAFASAVSSSRCGPNTYLWLCGNSLGCLPALSLAARRSQWLAYPASPHRCVLWLRNPPALANTILRVADRYASRSWMQRIVAHLPDELNAIHSAGQCQLPAVFLMSERDELVPPPLQRNIHRAYAGDQRVVTLADLGHGGPIDDQHLPEIMSAIHWLAEQETHS